MVLQSIDHAKAAYTSWYGLHESWYELPTYDSAWFFIMRLLTHPCAPGFAMLMGIGVTYFVRSRKALDWSDGRLLKHFFIRGFVLVFINLAQSWGMAGSFPVKNILFATTVLHALGVNFFTAAVVLIASNHLYSAIKKSLTYNDHTNIDAISKAEKRANDLRIMVIFELAAALMILNVLIVPEPVPGGVVEGYGWWRYMLYLPGLSSFFISMYPALNWLGLTLYGVGLGLVMIRDKRSNHSNSSFNALLAVGWFTLFLVIRCIGGFGNINPSLVGAPDASGILTYNPFFSSWIAFFNTIKYPPDLAYSALFLTANHIFLALCFLLPTGPDANKYVSAIITNGPLLDFGRSALFFYVIHFYLYFGSAAVIGHFVPSLKNPETGMLAMNGLQFFIAWMIGLVVLWFMCKRYATFKTSRGPDSIFRFF
ncbi:hypothetical protein VKS41_006717 [Umbelopsis sp. WA50703]